MLKHTDVESCLIEELLSIPHRTYKVCCANPLDGGPSVEFYSPFTLALIGIIASQTSDTRLIPLVQSIKKQLIETPNSNGVYNFYGNTEYPADWDTTSLVNLVIGDTYNEIQRIGVLKHITRRRTDGLFYTWFDRPSNNTDWFVNVNILVLLKKMGVPSSELEHTLSTGASDFSRHGSRYYLDVRFPLFMLAFYANEGLLDYKYFTAHNGAISLGVNDDTVLRYMTCPHEMACLDGIAGALGNLRHFNSSKAYYTSRVLDVAIVYYLLKSGKRHE